MGRKGCPPWKWALYSNCSQCPDVSAHPLPSPDLGQPGRPCPWCVRSFRERHGGGGALEPQGRHVPYVSAVVTWASL